MKVTVVGLGPAGLASIDSATRSLLEEPATTVVVRTIRHPAAQEVAELRPVIACDDLYEASGDFDAVYASIVQRVIETATKGPTVYAVPGSPIVGERTVPLLRVAARAAGIGIAVRPGLSFLDLAYAAVDVDPIVDGAQILDARDLPDPLPLHLPTFITQVDSHLRSSDVAVALGRLLSDHVTVTVLDRLGDVDEMIDEIPLSELASHVGGSRTTVFVPPSDVGLFGLVATNRVLRSECPWDREQTHHTLASHLIEEAYETADAIGSLPAGAPGGDPDFGAYAEVEEELGDLLLQVVFHATLASEAGAFDIDEVAEQIRRKLVRRHPHVFGDVDVDGAAEVLANWEQIKQEEKGRRSLMDDIPSAMPPIARSMKVQKRAASVSFDWDDAMPVFGVLDDEIAELRAAAGDKDAEIHELGDVLFSVINLARHLDVDPEIALRASTDRFRERFRTLEAHVEAQGRKVSDVPSSELESIWQIAKKGTMEPPADTA